MFCCKVPLMTCVLYKCTELKSQPWPNASDPLKRRSFVSAYSFAEVTSGDIPALFVFRVAASSTSVHGHTRWFIEYVGRSAELPAHIDTHFPGHALSFPPLRLYTCSHTHTHRAVIWGSQCYYMYSLHSEEFVFRTNKRCLQQIKICPRLMFISSFHLVVCYFLILWAGTIILFASLKKQNSGSLLFRTSRLR